jgi:hypothetical protein
MRVALGGQGTIEQQEIAIANRMARRSWLRAPHLQQRRKAADGGSAAEANLQAFWHLHQYRFCAW